MLAKMIDRITELAQPVTYLHAASNIEFWTHNRTVVAPPLPNSHVLQTLRGFAEYVERRNVSNGPVTIVVDSPWTVRAFEPLDEYAREPEICCAQYLRERSVFKFETWHPLDEFIIKLQAQFNGSEDKDLLLRVLGSVTGEGATTSADDGVTQTVTVRIGAQLRENETITNPVLLNPMRTFYEITQPQSPFIVRLRGQGKAMEVALFEADGGEWQLEAMSDIRDWLSRHLTVSDLVIC